MQKLLVILGPTATGKSDLAVELAELFNGEVISADSRQVYRGLDIGTGKITREEMHGIRHHLLDIADPNDRFTVARWKAAAEEAVSDIAGRGKLPIICGGTGYYISALIEGIEFPEIETDAREQEELESKTAQDLYAELQSLDPRRAASMSKNGERTNRRRLARAILIARKLGAVPALSSDPLSKWKADATGPYDPVIIGLNIPDAELKARIRDRLIRRLDAGMIDEAVRLHENGLSFERMDELGLEYRYLAKLIRGDISRDELIETLSAKIWQYARRQRTWFKRDDRIAWFSPSDRSAIIESARRKLST
ncbi:tRNA (adenosine(37)-N6)-dimethylallyltransferase MiaA [Patescibacteria group bacterium]|nr:tRNA (adenosine(37)-N6)-dimethylallyltransferase MiaA [Patescibacteria group bacterium]